ncbi:hypothetical protein JCM9957A_10370 [Kineosporia succinea]|uniref:Uncharacterized protein n=1 Tax=Kineosporia succinea TaxID=84632 RepID=A0ABT9P6K8_9ACTN|nr:hypothetical protein [Kineosporia succinea]
MVDDVRTSSTIVAFGSRLLGGGPGDTPGRPGSLGASLILSVAGPRLAGDPPAPDLIGSPARAGPPVPLPPVAVLVPVLVPDLPACP